jgi:hypothetical protein
MKASELRIGNLVYNKEENIVYVNTNHLTLLLYGIEDEFNPIPLTEEWLIKLGAKKDKIDNTYYLSELEIMLPNFFRYKTSIISRIDYVHQLQNLYFVLTGEELKQQEQ